MDTGDKVYFHASRRGIGVQPEVTSWMRGTDMPYSGRLETRPLLDVIQIVAYSQQSGLLTVSGPDSRGSIVFHEGNVVCAYSPSALPLLVKAAKATDERHRLTLRRIQILEALRELFAVREGEYRFIRSSKPVTELQGLDIQAFYAAGALDTGDLLLVLEKSMDGGPPELPPTAAGRPTEEQAEQRRFPRYGPVIIRGEVATPCQVIAGYLTNLSAGGTFFHADELPELDRVAELRFELPWELGPCRARVQVVWLRSAGPYTKRGAGLSFLELFDDSQEKLAAFLERFRELASAVDFEA